MFYQIFIRGCVINFFYYCLLSSLFILNDALSNIIINFWLVFLFILDEQQKQLMLNFWDLQKPLDKLPRSAIWTTLARFGCPGHFVCLIRMIHGRMKGWVKHCGASSDLFTIIVVLKQDCVLLPKSFPCTSPPKSIRFPSTLMAELAWISDTESTADFLTSPDY